MDGVDTSADPNQVVIFTLDGTTPFSIAFQHETPCSNFKASFFKTTYTASSVNGIITCNVKGQGTTEHLSFIYHFNGAKHRSKKSHKVRYIGSGIIKCTQCKA